MSHKSIMCSRLASELDHAFERSGWTADEVKKLALGTTLADVRAVIQGRASITTALLEPPVDLMQKPHTPEGWSVEDHICSVGQRWFPTDVAHLGLRLVGRQKEGLMRGTDVRNELKGAMVMNANVLDYLLEHQELIPKGWEGKSVCFWGTVYTNRDRLMCVRYLYKSNGVWSWHFAFLNYAWPGDMPAAVHVP